MPASDSGSIVNSSHFKNIPGILKLVALVVGVLCTAAGTPAFRPGSHFFLFVVYTNLIITCLWIIFILFRIQNKIRIGRGWATIEMLYPGIASLTYMVATIVQFSALTNWHGDGRARSYIAAVFGILASISYAASTFFGFKSWKSPPASEVAA